MAKKKNAIINLRDKSISSFLFDMEIYFHLRISIETGHVPIKDKQTPPLDLLPLTWKMRNVLNRKKKLIFRFRFHRIKPLKPNHYCIYMNIIISSMSCNFFMHRATSWKSISWTFYAFSMKRRVLHKQETYSSSTTEWEAFISEELEECIS